MTGRVTIGTARAVVRDDIVHSVLAAFNETLYIHIIHVIKSYNLKTGIELKHALFDELAARLFEMGCL